MCDPYFISAIAMLSVISEFYYSETQPGKNIFSTFLFCNQWPLEPIICNKWILS